MVRIYRTLALVVAIAAILAITSRSQVCAQAAFCEGFEDTNWPQAWEPVHGSYVWIDSTWPVHSGKHAIYLTGSSQSDCWGKLRRLGLTALLGEYSAWISHMDPAAHSQISVQSRAYTVFVASGYKVYLYKGETIKLDSLDFIFPRQVFTQVFIRRLSADTIIFGTRNDGGTLDSSVFVDPSPITTAGDFSIEACFNAGNPTCFDDVCFAPIDTDDDQIPDDGDGDGITGNHPCKGGNTVDCDDNCPANSNPDQSDQDSDEIGDVCDLFPHDSLNDIDKDGVSGDIDNCPFMANADQTDADQDSIGDACDNCTDTDGDGFGDPGFSANTCGADNCPSVSNPLQFDSNNDGIGDACCCVGTRGNVNCTGIIDLSDLSFLIAYLTITPKPTLCCPNAANINATGIIDLSDLSLLIAYLTAAPRPTLPNCP